MFHYTLLKQDGTTQDLGVFHKKMLFREMYKILWCTTVETIPAPYYRRIRQKINRPAIYAPNDFGRCTMFADEDARANTENHRNPHFHVLTDVDGSEWDIVGDVIMEQTEISYDRSNSKTA